MRRVTALVACLAVAACDVDQTREAVLPDVDVQVEEGQMPAFDIDWLDVEVGTTERTVRVPKLRVVVEEETISVPVIEVTMPDDGEVVERTLAVAPEVPHPGYDVEILEIYAAGERVHVVATLEETNADAPQQTVQISDRVVLNSPDVDVRYYIVGERPQGVDNGQYVFLSSLAELPKQVRNGRRIYEARM